MIRHEGKRHRLYRDSVGKFTIGVGRNLTDGGLSDDEINLLLDNDIRKFYAAAQKEVWWTAVADDPVRSSVMVELCFNLGIGGVRGFHKALAALLMRDWEACAQQFKASKWYSQVGSAPGQRGYELVEMLRTGKEG